MMGRGMPPPGMPPPHHPGMMHPGMRGEFSVGCLLLFVCLLYTTVEKNVSDAPRITTCFSICEKCTELCLT